MNAERTMHDRPSRRRAAGRGDTADVVDVLFIVLPDSLLLDLAGPAEVFRLANQHLQRLGRPAAFRLRYAGPQAQVVSSVGLGLGPIDPLPRALSQPTWVVLLGRPGDASVVVRHQRAWLQTRDALARLLGPALAQAEPVHRLITVCVGTLLAADAGLIGQRQVTTHHEMLDDLARLAPRAKVLPNRLFVEDGPLLTSAGITAGIDLALHAVASHCGAAVAQAVARVMVVFSRRGPLDPQASPLLAFRDHLHPALHRVQDAVEAAPGEDWEAEKMASLACVTPRHLGRLFKDQLGTTPRDYVELLRATLARQAMVSGAEATAAARTAGFRNERQMHAALRRHAPAQSSRPSS
jgi:transcriptional regulator GlxA family with amidase domain